jgi:hypothetical protein
VGPNPAALGKNRSVYENPYEKAENLYVKAMAPPPDAETPAESRSNR